MPKRAFFDNIGTILLFAVVGTFFNACCIAFTLYGLGTAGIGIISTFFSRILQRQPPAFLHVSGL